MRTLGNLGITVGLSLALEGDFDKVMSNTDNILINLRTLVKTVIEASLTNDEYKKKSLVTEWVLDDINKLAEIVNEKKGARPVDLVIYNPSYATLRYHFKGGEFWKPKTFKQIEKENIIDSVCKKVSSKLKDLVKNTVCNLPDFSGEALIITSYPVDLVMTKATSRLFLLERYTGLVKPFNLWYTKLTGGDKLANMPFNKLTIMVFGDKSVTFKSSKQGLKDEVKELAIKGRWTPFTTVEKVRSTINRYCNAIDRHFYLKCL